MGRGRGRRGARHGRPDGPATHAGDRLRPAGRRVGRAAAHARPARAAAGPAPAAVPRSRITGAGAPVQLAECTWPEAAALAADERAVVLLPLGAVEQHGPHLPLLVDWLGSEALARLVAGRLARAGWRPVLAPAVPYGVSTLAETWAGTASLSRSTLARVVVEIVRNLARPGFRRFVLVTYQADPDHLRALGSARRVLERDPGVQILFAGFSPDPAVHALMLDPRVLDLLRSPRPAQEWHSGELETALVLATRPSLVRRRLVPRLRPSWVDFRGALARGARRFEDLGGNGQGYFGWPAAARAETGRKALTLRADLFAEHLLARLADAPPGRRGTPRPGRRTSAP
jgi:creatinine amidohydrolase/Fe(II)-dependent formamide hydrolase-like protein